MSVNVTTPGGVPARWAPDDPNPRNQPQALTFSTTVPGGFESFSLTLQRDPRLSYLDLEELSMVTIEGVGGQVAWQGRLEQLPDTGGAQAQVSPQGSGWQNHLQDDNAAAMIYVDQNLTTWQGPPLARQIQLLGANFQLGSNSVASDPGNNKPALILEVDGAYISGIEPDAEAWYDSGVAGPIAVVYYDLDFPTNDPNWTEEIWISPTDDLSGATSSGNLASTSEVTGYFTGAGRYAAVLHTYATSPSGADNATFQAYWRPAVYGDHGLTGSGPDPVGFLASDVAAHAVSTWAPKLAFTTGANGTIQPSSFVIPQLAFLTPTTASAIIQQIVQYELLDWAVWEGPSFYLNPLGQSAKTRYWRTMVGPAQLQETGPDINRLWNGVIVSFQNVDGTSGTVGPPGSGAQTTSSDLLDTDPQNPANQAGINRWGPLSMGTTTPAAAIQVGAQYLQVQAQLNTSGQASLVGHVQDTNSVWWPAWAVRAGDYIAFTDAADSSNRRIVSTSYDDTSKTNSIQLDQPPDTTAAVLQRMSAVIQPLGFS